MKKNKEVFGIIGRPLGHSLSPRMHSAAYRAMGIDARYELLETEELASTMDLIRERSIRGVSVTIPYKREILPFLDEVDADVSEIGAVNTVTNEGGRLRGCNTDWVGLAADLQTNVKVEGKEVAVLGAGGAARAALRAVKRLGGHAVVVNRTVSRGETLASELGCGFLPVSDLGACRAEGLINTTPVGMWPRVDASPVSLGILGRFLWVADCIYNPAATRLLREAARAGCMTLDGVGMFVNQGAEQIRIWTGKDAPRDVMRRVVMEALGEREKMRS